MSEMNYEQARHNMIEQQIRPCDVLDSSCLETIQEIPRENFVPKQFKQIAFSDTEIPLQHQQKMLEPKLEAKILQAIQINANDKILEIGTGTGYLTALLASKAKTVHTIDKYDDLIETARENLSALNINNVTFSSEDFNDLDLRGKFYDIIVVSGSLPSVAEKLKLALYENGRLFVVIGKAPLMLAMLYTRTSDNHWMENTLFETELGALENTQEKEQFIF